MMQPASIFFFALLGGAVLASPKVQAQTDLSLLINGQPFDEKGCQQLSLLKTLRLPKINQDSVGVHITLAHGMRGIGAKGFTSIAAFNAFDLTAWLQLTNNDGISGNIDLDDNGDSFTKYKAMDGSRLVILVFSYKKKIKKSRMHKVSFCAS